MKNLFSGLVVAAVLLALFGLATASSLGGVVWFDWRTDEAPCTEVSAYADRNYSILAGWDLTDSCGTYTIIGLEPDTWYWIELIFPKLGCYGGSWSGTCDSTAIRDSVYTDPLLQHTLKDWDLFLDDCENDTTCN